MGCGSCGSRGVRVTKAAGVTAPAATAFVSGVSYAAPSGRLFLTNDVIMRFCHIPAMQRNVSELGQYVAHILAVEKLVRAGGCTSCKHAHHQQIDMTPVNQFRNMLGQLPDDRANEFCKTVGISGFKVSYQVGGITHDRVYDRT